MGNTPRSACASFPRSTADLFGAIRWIATLTERKRTKPVVVTRFDGAIFADFGESR
jgi:hypothetical protein